MLEEQKSKETVDEKSWIVLVEISSEKCPNRFRKWRPPQKGYFCELTMNICDDKFCKLIKEEYHG